MLSNVLAQMTGHQVEVFLPRFTLESTFGLNDTLAAMGMPDAFTPFVADFSGIDGMEDLYVSFVVHKAWGEVNEAGTQAAGATVIGVVGTAVPSGGPPIFRADHPFIFFIRDTQSGSVLSWAGWPTQTRRPLPRDAPVDRHAFRQHADDFLALLTDLDLAAKSGLGQLDAERRQYIQ